jgi:hypothetical protein
VSALRWTIEKWGSIWLSREVDRQVDQSQVLIGTRETLDRVLPGAEEPGVDYPEHPAGPRCKALLITSSTRWPRGSIPVFSSMWPRDWRGGRPRRRDRRGCRHGDPRTHGAVGPLALGAGSSAGVQAPAVGTYCRPRSRARRGAGASLEAALVKVEHGGRLEGQVGSWGKSQERTCQGLIVASCKPSTDCRRRCVGDATLDLPAGADKWA